MPKIRRTIPAAELQMPGLHITMDKKGEFRYYGYSNGNPLERSSESYKRREGVFTMLFSIGRLFDPGLLSIVLHDHTRSVYRRIRVIKGTKRGQYIIEDLDLNDLNVA